MARLVVDLTEFNDWSGHLTGIQRVVHRVAVAVGEADPAARFVSYDSGRRVFVEDSLERISLLADQVDCVAGGPGPRAVVVDRVAGTLSAHARLSMSRMAAGRRTGLEVLLRRLRRLVSRVSVRTRAPAFGFHEGDLLVSGGRVWNEPDYLAAISDIRDHTDIGSAFIIYDLIPVYLRHTFTGELEQQFVDYLMAMVPQADHLLPISEFTRGDLLKFCRDRRLTPTTSIHQLPLGSDLASGSTIRRPPFVVDDGEFAICVGTIEPRKNHVLIYLAYKLAIERGIELPRIYMLGRPGWLSGDLIHVLQNDASVRDRIVMVHTSTDAELAWMYRNAAFSVYPSQYEGWGLPVAESMAAGTPCVTTTSSSLPEVAGDLADYVSPYDPGQLLDAMVRLRVPSTNAARRAQIKVSYRPNTWQDAAELLVTLRG